MADYSQSKPGLGAIFPEHAIQTDFLRTEPLLTVDQLKGRYLFGIPLVSNLVDPISGMRQVMTDDLLRDYIIRAVAKAETLIGIDVFPVQYQEKIAFDRNLYVQFMYMQTRRRPILSVEKLSVTPSDMQDIYVFSPDWIEPNGFSRGRINVVPIQVGFNGGSYIPLSNNGTGGAAFLSIIAGYSWVPAYWMVEYTAGFLDGAIPKILNELIGILTCIDILSLLGSTYRTNSHSLSLDGVSQSVSGPGPQVFDNRIKMLETQKTQWINKIKALYSIRITSSNI